MDNNINVNQQQKKPRKDVSGCHNPMYGRKHSEASRNKMSQAATLRNQHHVSMDEFLANNPSVKEYIKVLANSIIKEEINKFVWNKQHQNQRISIPL